ncbi:hypothetical protein [Blastomonas sp.]
MTPGPMLAAMKTIEEMAARAEAMTFMMLVPCVGDGLELVWIRR